MSNIVEEYIESTANFNASGNAPDGADLARHWDDAFTSSQEKKLGWFETDLSPSWRLLNKAEISKEAKILVAGAGNSRLIDELVANDYENIIATDISAVALNQLRARVGEKVNYVVDDLTNSANLGSYGQVEFWFDRAVLHFFARKEERLSYRALLNKLVAPGGYIALAEFAEDGALKCSGLNVQRYSLDDMLEFLGAEFELIDSFRYIYTMPSRTDRSYNYALFRRSC